METSSVVVSVRGRARSLSKARELVAAWQASGDGVARWCQRQGHARSALKSWRERIAVADGASSVGGFIALHRPRQATVVAPVEPGVSAVVVAWGDDLRVLGLDVAGVAALMRELGVGGRS